MDLPVFGHSLSAPINFQRIKSALDLLTSNLLLNTVKIEHTTYICSWLLGDTRLWQHTRHMNGQFVCTCVNLVTDTNGKRAKDRNTRFDKTSNVHVCSRTRSINFRTTGDLHQNNRVGSINTVGVLPCMTLSYLQKASRGFHGTY
jgi:hypothetical protein